MVRGTGEAVEKGARGKQQEMNLLDRSLINFVTEASADLTRGQRDPMNLRIGR